MKRRQGLIVALALLTAACGRERQPQGAQGEPSEEGTAMRMPSVERLPAMRAHLDSVRLAGPGELPGMVSGHRVLAEEMLTAMDQDMKAMSMTADAGWGALADSVRSDLTALPVLNGEPLLLRMRAHAGRMRRLLERHEAMIKM